MLFLAASAYLAEDVMTGWEFCVMAYDTRHRDSNWIWEFEGGILLD